MAQQTSLAAFGLEDRSYSIDEWLAVERRTGEKFEYHEGRLVPVRMMSGGTAAHAHLGANVVGSLYAALLDRADAAPCNVYTSDLQVMINDRARYVYPDAAVICGRPEFDARVATAVRNPVVVAEVLSPSSVGYDTGEKFAYYASLATLREYVLVEQSAPWVEVRSREGAGGPWTITFATALGSHARLPSLGIELAMTRLYRGVEFPSPTGGGE